MKFLTREVKIAITAIIAVVLLFLLINFLKGINVFKSTNTYYVEFPDIAGLTVSNAVYANGYPVGIVRTINYDYSRTDRVIVGMELDKSMRVPAGTVAELSTSLMGGVKMSLVLGPNPLQTLSRGDTIRGGMHAGAMDQVESLMPTITAMVPKLDSILANFNRLSADPALTKSLANTAELTGNLAKTSAQLNKMMADDIPSMMAKLNATSQNLQTLSGNLSKVDVEKTMAGVDATITEMQQFSENLKAISTTINNQINSRDNSMGLLMQDRALYDNLNQTIKSADSLLTDLKAHPKRYVHFSVFGKKDK